MKTVVNVGLSVIAIALAFPSGQAQAAVAEHTVISNSVNYCQAFTPGPANTIRNRVIGAENVGAAMNVACNFPLSNNGAAGGTVPTELEVWFSNNSSAAITVSCTLLTGYQGDSNGYAVTKSVSVPVGTAQRFLSWGAADNPTTGATTLGNNLVGVNCSLPTGAVINDTYLFWNMDNGV